MCSCWSRGREKLKLGLGGLAEDTKTGHPSARIDLEEHVRERSLGGRDGILLSSGSSEVENSSKCQHHTDRREQQSVNKTRVGTLESTQQHTSTSTTFSE